MQQGLRACLRKEACGADPHGGGCFPRCQRRGETGDFLRSCVPRAFHSMNGDIIVITMFCTFGCKRRQKITYHAQKLYYRMCYGFCCDSQHLWKISISEISELVSSLGDSCLGWEGIFHAHQSIRKNQLAGLFPKPVQGSALITQAVPTMFLLRLKPSFNDGSAQLIDLLFFCGISLVTM